MGGLTHLQSIFTDLFTSSGSVSGEAQADRETLDAFVDQLRQGPSSASVSKVEQNLLSVNPGENEFGVH
jgi:hypothetical protein